ncbi:histone H2A-Bbd type 1-like [Rattus rattus]|uniref:histone H2A-Bbd type 1-like n=1 Tax=Rattus rattus TaxID=10117 RepID=UPI0013F35AA0|nr:histone H2A-Bbd type 1-like [Rattus rattus]
MTSTKPAVTKRSSDAALAIKAAALKTPDQKRERERADHTPSQPGTMEGKRQNAARSSRGKLHFPVNKVDRLLRERNTSKCPNSTAPVFLAGVLEYLTSNILDLAGKEAHNSGSKLISPEHVTMAIRKNEGFHQLLKDNKWLAGEIPGPSGTSALNKRSALKRPTPDETTEPDETPAPNGTPAPDKK